MGAPPMPTEGTTLLNSKGGAPSASSSPSLVERVKAEAATAAALLTWCEANPQATMCESSWREGSDPCDVDGWEGVFCDASGVVIEL